MSSCSTWEEAAREAAAEVAKLDWSWDDECLDEIELDIDELRGDRGCNQNHRLHHWRYMAVEAAAGLLGENGYAKGQALRDVLDDVVTTVISKQHDYGHQNILWGGVEGVILRAHDKVARIRNLLSRSAAITAYQAHAAFDGPMNEALVDSWSDIIGYALIGIMLENGSFTLPLKADSPSTDGESSDGTFELPLSADVEGEIETYAAMWDGAIDDLVAAMHPQPEEVLFVEEEEDAIRAFIAEEIRSELMANDGMIYNEIKRQLGEYETAQSLKRFWTNQQQIPVHYPRGF